MEIIEFLNKIRKTKLREQYIQFYKMIEEDMHAAPASVKYHHNWKGGYFDHVEQVMNLSYKCFREWEAHFMSSNVNIDDVIIVSFIHDLDKLHRYEKNPDFGKKGSKGDYQFRKRKDIHNYSNEMEVLRLLGEHGISLTKIQTEALAWHEGGWSDAAILKHNSNNPLPVIIHIADLFSAKILKDEKR